MNTLLKKITPFNLGIFFTTAFLMGRVLLLASVDYTNQVGVSETVDDVTFNNIRTTEGWVFEVDEGSSLNYLNQSSAKNAVIDLGNTIGNTEGILRFMDTASADTSLIHARGTSNITFLDNALVHNASIILDQFTTLNFEQAGDDIWNGIVSGNGTINKNGSGFLDLSAVAEFFTGSLHVYQGRLSVNTIFGGTAFVHEQGTLSGNGTIIGDCTIYEGGFIRPGNSIGTLSIGGNFHQFTNSVYQVELDYQQTSLIDVAGVATIDPDVSVEIIGPSAQLSPNSSLDLTILQATGGVAGEYTSLTSNNPLITASLIHDPNSVSLHFVNTLSLLPFSGIDKEMVDLLQEVALPSEHQQVFLNGFVGLPEHRQRSVLNKLTGSVVSNVAIQAEWAGHQFIQRMFNPLRDFSTTTSCYLDKFGDPRDDEIWDVWMDASYVRNFLDGVHRVPGFNTSGYALTLGAQTNYVYNYTFGGAISYENAHYRYNNGDRGDGYNVLGGIYSLYRAPSQFYLLGNAIFGFSEQTLRRRIQFSGLRFEGHSTPNVYQGVFYVEAAKDVRFNCLLAQPFVGLEAGIYRRNRIKEHGNDLSSIMKLDIQKKSIGTGYGNLGVHFISNPLSTLSVNLDLSWRYRWTTPNANQKAHFRGFGGDFTVLGMEVPRSSFNGALNLTANVIDGLEMYTQAYGEWWHRANSYSILLGFQGIW